MTKVFECHAIDSTSNLTSQHNDWAVNAVTRMAFPNAPAGVKMVIIPFTFINGRNDEGTMRQSTPEKNFDHSFGGRQFIKYSNLQLKLLFAKNNSDLTNGTTYYLDLYGLIHNNLILIQGDFRRVLA